MIRAVATSSPSARVVGIVEDAFIGKEGTVVLEVLVVVDRNTVVLPLGRRAVALTRVGENVAFVPLGDDEGIGTIENADEEDGVSGQTVATGT